MGIEKNISIDKFPRQGDLLNRRTKVCFHYNADKIIFGTIVRYDSEEPFKTIIKLDDDRYVLATECMHSPIW